MPVENALPTSDRSHRDRLPEPPDKRILRASLPPLLALGAIALAGTGSPGTAGRWALALAAAFVALAATPLLWRLGRDGRRAEPLLACLCVFALGAAVAVANLPLGGDVGGFWTANRQPPPNLVRLPPPSMQPPPAEPGTPPDPAAAGKLLIQGIELEQRGQAAAAIAAYREGLQAAQAVSDADSAVALSVALSKALLQSGDPAAALEAARNGVTMSHRSTKRHDGAPLEDAVRLLLIEGLARAATGDGEAIPTVERALALCDEHHGDNLALREEVVSRLSDLLRAKGDRDALLAAVEDHLGHVERTEPRDPQALASWHEEAGRLLGAAGRFGESADHFEKAVTLREEGPAADPLKAAFSRVNLARSLLGAGQRGRALAALETARKVLGEKLPPDHDARRAADSLYAELSQLPK